MDPPGEEGMFSNEILAEFATHSQHLREAARRRREECTLKNAVEDPRDQEETDVRATFGVPQPGEVMAGDTAIRTLHQLLHIIDENGFERSPHQQRFHDAMIRAVARVLYRADWATKRPDIMARHGWTKAPSEVLISTPRRFGKAFRRDARPGVPVAPSPCPRTRTLPCAVSPSWSRVWAFHAAARRMFKASSHARGGHTRQGPRLRRSSSALRGAPRARFSSACTSLSVCWAATPVSPSSTKRCCASSRSTAAPRSFALSLRLSGCAAVAAISVRVHPFRVGRGRGSRQPAINEWGRDRRPRRPRRPSMSDHGGRSAVYYPA